MVNMNIAKNFINKLKNEKKLLIQIYNNVFYYVVLTNNNNSITIEEHNKTTDIVFIKNKIKNFNKIHFVISPEKRIYEQIKVNNKIKDLNSLNLIIRKQLSEKYENTEKIIYKFYKENEENEETEYVVDGFYSEEFIKYSEILDDLNKLEFSTIDTYSFNSIVELCNKENNSFISIYEEKDKIIIIANDGKQVVFSRIIEIEKEQDKNAKNLQIIEYIIKNYKFIVQKVLYSDKECKNIFLIGDFSEDDFVLSILKENIKDINISTIYPYTFIKGINHINLYEYISIIGSVVKNDLYNFTPHFISRKIQLSLLKNFTLFIVFILFIFNLFNFNETYNVFTDLKIKNDFFKNEYNKHTNKVLFEVEELKKIENFYNLKLKFYNENLVNDLKNLYDFLIKYDKKNIDISYSENKKIMNISGNKNFKNLLELNIFIQNITNELKNTKYEISNIIDYKELNVNTIFTYSIEEAKEITNKNEKRKRK